MGKIGLSETKKAEILILCKQGFSERRICKEVSCSKTAVHQAIVKFKNSGIYTEEKKRGRPRKVYQLPDEILKEKKVAPPSISFSKKTLMDEHGNKMVVQEQSSNNTSTTSDEGKSTRLKPLGQECIISNTEVTDQAILNKIDYYWYISKNTGCVECAIKKTRPRTTATITDPKCVITKKHRRFEAYCCMICRSNFVTIVQALLHLKNIHRPRCKIVIQDKDIFHDSDKSTEETAVPLPAHIAKAGDYGKPAVLKNTISASSFAMSPNCPVSFKAGSPFTFLPLPGSLAELRKQASLPIPIQRDSSSPVEEVTSALPLPEAKEGNAETHCDPMVAIISAITAEFKKQVKRLAFEEDCSQINATFLDNTDVIAKTPWLVPGTTKRCNSASELNTSEPLKFFFDHNDSSKDINQSSTTKCVTLRTNRPAYARILLASRINSGDDPSCVEGKQKVSPEQFQSEGDSNSNLKKSATEEKNVSTTEVESASSKHGRIRTLKSVSFKLGAPDSSDEEIPNTLNIHHNSAEASNQQQEVKTSKNGTFDDRMATGLKNVVQDLMATASKGRFPIPSTFPNNLSTQINHFLSSSSLPAVGSTPTLSDMAPSTTNGLVASLARNQSWSSSGIEPSLSIAAMRRPYVSRGFTYAQKIAFMNQQNAYDEKIVKKHIGNNEEKQTNKQSRSEGDLPLSPLNEETKSNKDEDETSSLDSRHESSDTGDSAIPALLNSVSTMQTVAFSNPLTSSGLFPSEYYGSGEWATTAMETLKSLQAAPQVSDELQIPHSSSSAKPSPGVVVKMEKLEEDLAFEDDSSFHDAGSSHQECFSDDNFTTTKSKLLQLVNSRKRCKSDIEIPSSPPKRRNYKKYLALNGTSISSSTTTNSTKSFVKRTTALELPSAASDQNSADQIGPPPLTAIPKLDSYNHSPKVPISPLISDEENDHILHQQNSHRTIRKATPLPSPAVQEQPIQSSSELPDASTPVTKSMGSKCLSEPNLSSRATRLRETTTKPGNGDVLSHGEEVLLKSGDTIRLESDVSLDDFCNNKLVTAKLQTSVGSSALIQDDVMMDMPELFKNCVDTYVKIKCVQKLSVCKVCGFAIDVTNATPDCKDVHEAQKALQYHITEHSLKELYSTGFKCRFGYEQ